MPFASVIRRLGRGPQVALITILGIVLLAVLAPLVATHPPTHGELGRNLMPPAWIPGGDMEHLLGTDKLGRDVLSRVFFGARVSLIVAGASIIVAGLLGTAIGLVAGYFGGLADSIIMRVVDLTLSLPIILLAFVLAVLFSPSFTNVIIILVAVLWAEYARQVRAEALSLREADFVKLARVGGVGPAGIMFRHILPNLMNTILVLGTLQVGRVILVEAALSFLGVGIPPPEPAWGLMVAEGRGLIRSAWWVSLFPGIAITGTILALNVLSDGLRDALDPKSLRAVL